MVVRQPQQGKSAAPWIIAVSIGLAAYAGAYGYPAVPIVWLGLVVSAFAEPPVILTGPKDRSTGMPTPATAAEERRVQRFGIWRDLRTRLLLPGSEWLPGNPLKPLKLTWLIGVFAAYSAAFVPALGGSIRLANMAAAFVVIAIPCAVRRNRMAPENPCPGVVLNVDGDWLTKANKAILAGAAATSVVVVVVSSIVFGSMVKIGRSVGNQGVLPPVKLPSGVPEIDFATPWWMSTYVLGALLGVCVVLAAVYPLLRSWSLSHWRIVVNASREWKPRWSQLKQDPPPRLLDRQSIGSATIDTFVAPPGLGSAAFFMRAAEITPTIGDGRTVAVLEVPDTDSNGDPVLGRPSPTRFEVVSWADRDAMSPEAPGVSDEVARLAIRTLSVIACEVNGYGRPMPLDVTRITSDESPGTVWRVTFAWPGGPDLAEIRRSLLGEFQAHFQCDVLIDHRCEGGAGAMFVGALFDDDTAFVDEPPKGWAKEFEELAYEDQWNSWWGNSKKPGMTDLATNPPVISHETRKTYIVGGVEVHQAGFMMRQGAVPTQFFGLEPSLATTIPSCSMVDISSWPKPEGNGHRHDSAICVTWAQSPIPSRVERVPPGTGAQYVVMAAVNRAFDAAKLARPQLVTASPLTSRESDLHIWEVKVRLYGGVTLANLRKQHHSIKETLGVPWLRFKERPGSVVSIFAGAAVGDVTLARTHHQTTIAGLDWADAFFNARVWGSDGSLPELESAEPVPENSDVSVLTFKLPQGLDVASIRGAAKVVGANAGHAYFDVRPLPAPNKVLVMAAVDDPLPEHAPFEFDSTEANDAVPFATSPEGTTITFRPTDDPHVLLAGTTGSGKSVLAQGVVYWALRQGWIVYIIDPVKQAADFRFGELHCKAMAIEPLEAAVVMRKIYAEVLARVRANGAAGVGSFKDLENPPPRILVLVDEFTSLLSLSPPGKRTGNPETDAEVDRVELENAARTEVGTFIGRITREARSAGVTVALATQQLSAATLKELPGGSGLKTNLARVLLGAASDGERMSALRAPFDGPRVDAPAPKGRGVFEPTSSACTLMQVWYAPQERLRSELCAAVPELDPSERLDLKAEVAATRAAGAIIEDIFEDEGPPPALEEVFVDMDLGDFDLGEIVGAGEPIDIEELPPGGEPLALGELPPGGEPLDLEELSWAEVKALATGNQP